MEELDITKIDYTINEELHFYQYMIDSALEPSYIRMKIGAKRIETQYYNNAKWQKGNSDKEDLRHFEHTNR